MTDQDRKTAEEIVNRINGDVSRNGCLDAAHYRRYVQQIESALSAACGRWIPVGEGLPEVGADEDYARVLVLNKDGQFTANYYPGVAWVGDGGFLVGITHWMPAPEPPKEGEEND